jgi:hypothetical protein
MGARGAGPARARRGHAGRWRALAAGRAGCLRELVLARANDAGARAEVSGWQQQAGRIQVTWWRVRERAVLAALAAARFGADARQALATGRTADGCEWAQERSAAAAQSRARRKHAGVGAVQRWVLEKARVPERVAGGGARQDQHPCHAKQGKATPAVALAAAVQGREPDL